MFIIAKIMNENPNLSWGDTICGFNSNSSFLYKNYLYWRMLSALNASSNDFKALCVIIQNDVFIH